MEEEDNFPEDNLPSTSKQGEEAYDSESSADSSGVDKCPICLLAFSTDQEIGKPAVCEHIFCFPCIQEWSKVVQTCPIDRKEFQEIRVYGNVECDHLLRTVELNEKVALNELIGLEEFTACEVCRRIDREDCMLLCDGCDKGFHMDCLEPPLLEIPQDNWYCDDCFDSSDEESDDDPEELDDLNNDIDEELPGSRLRNRQQQPQILRTLQSERIRNAILARMSLRSTRQALGEGPSLAPVAKPRAVRKRRATRRRRARTVVVEYDVDGSDKFALKSRRVKRRKVKRRRLKTARRSTTKPIKAPAGPLNSFKSANPNIYELQRGRMKAGLSNFNIFQPTNQLDYVSDEEDLPDVNGVGDGAENSGGVLTQAIISLHNPQRRNLMIKDRVLQNCTTTSSAVNLLDSIMQDQDMFGPGSIRNRFAVEKSSGKLLFVGGDGARQCSGGDDGSGSGSEPRQNEPTEAPATQTSSENAADLESTSNPPQDLSGSADDRGESQNLPGELFASTTKDSPPDKKKKPKKPEIDMFDENPNPEDDCPNFSIYDSVDAMVDQDASNSFQIRPNVYHEENVDMVQMSDESSQGAPPAIVASQPASPDLENDKVGESMPERSYTPPIAQKTSDDGPEDDDYEKRRKERESKRNRKREVERYNVRDRLKDRSPAKLKDKFGRNRSRSSSRKRQPRRRSRSPSRDRNRRSRSHDRNYRKSRTFSRSRSRRRTPSLDHDRRKKLHKDRARKPPGRRSRSRSFTPRHHRPTTPDRRVRSRSKKAKKKRHRDHSKEKPSTMSKEVFTSGPNILVSVNFNNQDDKAAPKRSRSRDRDEPKEVVDITARKKIMISSKPVAIIDLARSPFRELTPEYQSNVIELSDSEGEKTSEKQLPKSPDSTISSKLYDPFDILNSPSNENVTSSQNTAALSLQKPPEKVPEPVKPNITYNKNIMALAVNSNLFYNEENLVTSSSSMVTIEKQPVPPPLAPKVDVLQNETVDVVPMDIAESPYSPGHEYDDTFEQHDESGAANRPAKAAKGMNIFDELFGSSSPPGLDRLKSKKGADKSADPNKYLMKLKRQERVIEEVKLVIKPYYSKRTINKEQYKEILRKAVPKICHSREINPQKIKVLIDSYVKLFKHRKKRSAPDEVF